MFSLQVYGISFLISIVSAHDPFEGLLPLGKACFPVRHIPCCRTTIPDVFEPKSRKLGNNKATTAAFLFTPKSPNRAEQLHLCGGKLPPRTTFDKNINTEIFIHGWLDGVCRTAWMREMKEQLMIRGRYNVILIDWTWGNTPDYFLASQNCKIVGEQVGFIINNIMEQTGVSPRKFHVIGHSFGGIATGFVGRSVKGLRRITALDPALAPFLDAPPEERVTYRDAEIVDVIHSNALDPGCFATNLGDGRHLGDADFYPNGGFIQPSCYVYSLISFFKSDILYALASLVPRFCAHLQSIQFYKVSINPGKCEFVGEVSDSYESYKKNKTPADEVCRDAAVMGMDYEMYRQGNSTKRKKYYLDTGIFCPYCDGSHNCEIEEQKGSSTNDITLGKGS